MKILNIKGFEVLLDDEDFERISSIKWNPLHTHGKTYFSHTYNKSKFREKRIHILLHREVFGEIPKGMVVDHINGNPFDCTRSNMRLCTVSQNTMNGKRHRDNSTGFKGVVRAPGGRFMVQIGIDMKMINLGTFDTAEEAYSAYLTKGREIHAEFFNPGA